MLESKIIEKLIEKDKNLNFVVFKDVNQYTKENPAYIAMISTTEFIEAIKEYVFEETCLLKKIEYLIDAPWFPFKRSNGFCEVINLLETKLNNAINENTKQDINITIDNITYMVKLLSHFVFDKNILNKQYDFTLRCDYKNIEIFKNLHMYERKEIEKFLNTLNRLV